MSKELFQTAFPKRTVRKSLLTVRIGTAVKIHCGNHQPTLCFRGNMVFFGRIPSVEQGVFIRMKLPPILRRILAPSHSALLHVAHFKIAKQIPQAMNEAQNAIQWISLKPSFINHPASYHRSHRNRKHGIKDKAGCRLQTKTTCINTSVPAIRTMFSLIQCLTIKSISPDRAGCGNSRNLERALRLIPARSGPIHR